MEDLRAGMPFVLVVGHVAGAFGADVRHVVCGREEGEERLAVAVSGGGAVAPCYAVSEGKDAQGGAIWSGFV